MNHIKKILVPTDFTAHSVNVAARAAAAINDRIDVYLFHAFEMPDSLPQAMNASHHKLITEDLRVLCRKIKNRNSNINNISFRSMYGTTDMAFRNYADANGIDLLVLPPEYKFFPAVPQSVNPLRMFRRSGIAVLSDLTPLAKEKQTMAEPVTIM